VTVTLNPAHTFFGDLDAHLAPPGVSPGAAGSHLLFDEANSAVGDAVMAGPYNFTDGAAVDFITAGLGAQPGVIPAGSYRTATDLPVKTSLNEVLGGVAAVEANGVWQLRVRDLVEIDTGTIAAASVTITGPTIAAALLPTSRSVQAPSGVASAFATIINVSQSAAVQCRLSPRTTVPGTFIYQTTNAANQLVGTPNTPVDVAPSGSQNFFFAFTPSGAFGPADVQINFVCDQSAAAIVTGLTTLRLVAATSPVPDVIALAATVGNTGIVDVPGNGTLTGAFSVATANVGEAGTLTVSADTGGATVPVTLSVCQTDAQGACIAGPLPSVTLSIPNGATPTFAVFASGQGVPIAFDPASTRIFLRVNDAGGIERGSTSVAVRSVP
jgi:hypothetical protein